MKIKYYKKPKIHLLRIGKALCNRPWIDGEEEGSKFVDQVNCKNCLRILKKEKVNVQGIQSK